MIVMMQPMDHDVDERMRTAHTDADTKLANVMTMMMMMMMMMMNVFMLMNTMPIMVMVMMMQHRRW